jgi:hypothetical protein
VKGLTAAAAAAISLGEPVAVGGRMLHRLGVDGHGALGAATARPLAQAHDEAYTVPRYLEATRRIICKKKMQMKKDGEGNVVAMESCSEAGAPSNESARQKRLCELGMTSTPRLPNLNLLSNSIGTKYKTTSVKKAMQNQAVH